MDYGQNLRKDPVKAKKTLTKFLQNPEFAAISFDLFNIALFKDILTLGVL